MAFGNLRLKPRRWEGLTCALALTKPEVASGGAHVAGPAACLAPTRPVGLFGVPMRMRASFIGRAFSGRFDRAVGDCLVGLEGALIGDQGLGPFRVQRVPGIERDHVIEDQDFGVLIDLDAAAPDRARPSATSGLGRRWP